VRALTGIKPTGTPHIGNYLGMIEPALALTQRGSRITEGLYFIADYHALTTLHDPVMLRQHSLDVAATWLALGLDPSRTCLFAQSDVPEVCELSWMLACMIGTGVLERAHAYKAAQDRKLDQEWGINVGVFTYPVLMAADILIYDSNVVPVGADQRQHVEMARDMAQAFNARFGQTLVVPEVLIREDVKLIAGLDGQKMSKSYNNTIPLFAPPKKLRKIVMSIVTDSTPLEDPKNPDTCNVFALYRHFSTPDQQATLAARYRAPGMGYGDAKQMLYEAMEARLAEPRERYMYLLDHGVEVEEVLVQGSQRARSLARQTMERVRNAAGFMPKIRTRIG
jgi:tryptophanyl-tRNA synthetase